MQKAAIIDDGYNFEGDLEAGMHSPPVAIVYRPATQAEVASGMEREHWAEMRAIKKFAEETGCKVSEIIGNPVAFAMAKPDINAELQKIRSEYIADHLVSWDARDHSGSEIPISRESVDRLEASQFNMLMGIVNGDIPAMAKDRNPVPDGRKTKPLPDALEEAEKNS